MSWFHYNVSEIERTRITYFFLFIFIFEQLITPIKQSGGIEESCAAFFRTFLFNLPFMGRSATYSNVSHPHQMAQMILLFFREYEWLERSCNILNHDQTLRVSFGNPNLNTNCNFIICLKAVTIVVDVPIVPVNDGQSLTAVTAVSLPALSSLQEDFELSSSEHKVA